jgi:hypothetical protein
MDSLPAMKRLARIVATLPCLAWSAGAAPLFNLDEPSPSPRFPVTDRVWPENVGDASLCLWHDDKLAALSITIDDNCAPDHDWWRAKADAHDFRATWFVITGLVSSGNRFHGTWEDFAELCRDGHAIGSHSVTHLKTDTLQPDGSPWSIDWEYRSSLEDLRRHLPDCQASGLAYPGGPNQDLNSRKEAAALFRFARSTTGTPNAANTIDYLNIRAMSRFHTGAIDGMDWCDLRNILDPSVANGSFHRGWAVLIAHSLNDEQKARWEDLFAFLDLHREDLWVAPIGDVAKYGQQRDTATVEVTHKADDEIRFTVRHEMDTAYYGMPLSVKVRVPDNWPEVEALLGDRHAPVSVISHERHLFAIIQVLAGQGEVICRQHR